MIAAVARLTHDIGLAEDFAQDALVAALERWADEGIPDNPGAWLTTAAKNRALDHLRRAPMLDRKHQELVLGTASSHSDDRLIDQLDRPIEDDVLRLIFTACHPVLPTEARVALTLKVIGGLSTKEIARAYLKTEATMAQRIVRAKRTLSEAKVAFALPAQRELDERLASALEVIYLIFNEGYAASSGEHWIRQSLCDEALRLSRVVAELMPKVPEVHGLSALLELQASRSKARVGTDGEPILLLEQDRTRWDQLLIKRGFAAIRRAERAAKENDGAFGPYCLQAAIAACHAQATAAEHTDWQRIAALYDALAQITSSPVVELNRAVAVGMAFGPDSGLEIVDDLMHEPTLQDYPHLYSVRGDLLYKLGRKADARSAFVRAAELTSNEREFGVLERRIAECDVDSR